MIGAGIIPGGMEMMDRPAIHAAEDFLHAGYPLDVEALLIIELDGPEPEVEHLIGVVEEIARGAGAISVQASRSEEERLKFWAGRKAAFPAVGRISPDYLCMDGTIPRHRLGDVLARIQELSAQYGLRCCNVFHAGDGNLHHLILHDAATPGDLEKVEAFGADILRACAGRRRADRRARRRGRETGSDGRDVHRGRPEAAQRLKCAFDPESLLNPGRSIPRCTAARNSGECTCIAASCASPTSHGFRSSRTVRRPTLSLGGNTPHPGLSREGRGRPLALRQLPLPRREKFDDPLLSPAASPHPRCFLSPRKRDGVRVGAGKGPAMTEAARPETAEQVADAVRTAIIEGRPWSSSAADPSAPSAGRARPTGVSICRRSPASSSTNRRSWC